ncbi:hypothetical protein AB0937_13455 [Streptomyces sp. NPDC047880]|uniref:hypothetical protein n=1 Tax=Streptomyces sp. NPDC047880 TaxID=3155626 RepID=UPI0034557E56
MAPRFQAGPDGVDRGAQGVGGLRSVLLVLGAYVQVVERDREAPQCGLVHGRLVVPRQDDGFTFQFDRPPQVRQGVGGGIAAVQRPGHGTEQSDRLERFGVLRQPGGPGANRFVDVLQAGRAVRQISEEADEGGEVGDAVGFTEGRAQCRLP